MKLRLLSLIVVLKPLKSTYISARPQEEGSFEAEAQLLADDHRVLQGPGARAVGEPDTLKANLGTSVRSKKISIFRKPVKTYKVSHVKIACGEVGRQQELVLLDQTFGGESHTAAGLTRRDRLWPST